MVRLKTKQEIQQDLNNSRNVNKITRRVLAKQREDQSRNALVRTMNNSSKRVAERHRRIMDVALNSDA